MKTLILGSGGREAALSWKLSNELTSKNVLTAPGNGGIANSHPLKLDNFQQIHQYVEENEIDLIIVGPEQPLSSGIVNYFHQREFFNIFGPTQRAAQLESSKLFAKQFMTQYGVQTAAYEVETSLDKIKGLTKKYSSRVVLKYDGLAAGKGVFVCYSEDDVDAALLHLQSFDHRPIVIEELLEGQEISIIGITDGQTIKLLLPSQDHKQLLNGDQGPNTGGMGAICPVPFCTASDLTEIVNNIVAPTLYGLQKEGFRYQGFIYFGLMMTRDGPYALEYNVRLGDPETQVILPALQSNLSDLIDDCLSHKLSTSKLQFNSQYYTCIVLASQGYPGDYQKGKIINGLNDIDNQVFCAGVRKEGQTLLTHGGRVLSVLGEGKSLLESIARAYHGASKIHFEGAYCRTDIGMRHYTRTVAPLR